MNQKDDIKIDIKQLFLYVWDHILIIVFASVFFSLVLGGIRYKQMITPINPNKVYNEILSMNKDAANPSVGVYSYSSDREIIKGSCVIRSQLYIDYNYDELNSIDNNDYNSIMSRYQNDVINVIFSGNTLVMIANQINNNDYSGVNSINADDLRYMLSWTTGASNTFCISVSDINVDRALDISNLLNKYASENLPKLKIINEVRVLDSPVVYYNTIGMPEDYSLSELIKFIIIGGFLGFVLTCLVYLFLYCINYTIRSTSDISNLDLVTYARIPLAPSKQNIEIKRMAYNMSSDNNIKKISLIPVDEKTDIDSLYKDLKSEIEKNNIELIKSENIVCSADVTLDAQRVDAVILVATFGKTRVSDLEFAKTEIEKIHKSILGVALYKCRH